MEYDIWNIKYGILDMKYGISNIFKKKTLQFFFKHTVFLLLFFRVFFISYFRFGYFLPKDKREDT